MAKSADISAYNPVLFTIIAQVRDTGSYEVTGSMSECMALRFEIYGFKRALTRAGHPEAIAAKQTSWFVEELPDGTAKLTGIRKDRTKLAEMARRGLLQDKYASTIPARPPGMETHAPLPTLPSISMPEEENPMESALRKLGFFTQTDKDKP